MRVAFLGGTRFVGPVAVRHLGDTGLATEVAALLGWEWEPVRVPFASFDHPWQTAHPVLCSDRRLRDVLGVDGPDPRAALAETVEWLWAYRHDLASACR